MEINFAQTLIIILIFLTFGTIITVVNLRSKKKQPANKEQTTWQTIDQLNNKKKELLDEKKELSFKYTAKNINENTYTKSLEFINQELEKITLQINKEVSKLTNIQEKDNPQDELRFKNIKMKEDLNEILSENTSLKERIGELEDFIKNVSKQQTIETKKEDVFKNKFYELIISKYKDHINQNERKTISELKEMIKPTDLTVKNITNKFLPIGYDYNKDYFSSLRKLYNFLRTEINIIKNDLKVIFWIDFSKVFKDKICDEQTSSVILCSCMHSMKDENAKIVVVLLENDKVHSFITTKIKETYYILDLVQNVPIDTFKDTNEDKLFKDYKFQGQKIIKKIYGYNNQKYFDYNEE